MMHWLNYYVIFMLFVLLLVERTLTKELLENLKFREGSEGSLQSHVPPCAPYSRPVGRRLMDFHAENQFEFLQNRPAVWEGH